MLVTIQLTKVTLQMVKMTLSDVFYHTVYGLYTGAGKIVARMLQAS